MSRKGKIARLPRLLRETINEQLEDGVPGKQIVAWLNRNEEAQYVVTEFFDGRPISEQNLSEWKQGGYRDWLRHQESLRLVERLAEEAAELDEAATGLPVSHLLADGLATELAATAQAVLEQTVDPKERFQQLRRVLHELNELRREDRRAMKMVREHREWQREERRRAEYEAEAPIREAKAKIKVPIMASLKACALARCFGGGRSGWEAAALLAEASHDLPFGTLIEHPPDEFREPVAARSDQAKSNQIKPENAPTVSDN